MPRLIQVIGLILIISIGVLLWAGFMREVVVEETTNDTIYGVYVEHFGSFYNVGESINTVQRYLRARGVNSEVTFAQYFQDPSLTPDELLTSWAGVIVDDPIDVAEPYKLMVIEPRLNVHAEFIGHPWLAPFKVMGKLNTYLLRRGYNLDVPRLEIFTPRGYGQKQIDYYLPVVRTGSGVETGVE